jgi:3-oxoacyl-[acyl-carrier protein] reductase
MAMGNKSVVITGGSRGIGRACAVTFAKNGYNVLIGYNKNSMV